MRYDVQPSIDLTHSVFFKPQTILKRGFLLKAHLCCFTEDSLVHKCFLIKDKFLGKHTIYIQEHTFAHFDMRIQKKSVVF